MADMIRENMRSFLRIEPANAQTIQIQENLDFDGNAARNRIWYRGDADELSQMYKLLPGDCQRDRFWAAVPTYGLNIRKIHTGIPGIIVDLLVSIVIADMNDVKVDGKYQDIWNEIAKDNNFTDMMTDVLSDTLVVGDGAFKFALDPNISEYPIIEFVSGENVEYVYKCGRLIEIIFRTALGNRHNKYVLKESYGKGYIITKLYKDGKEVDLKSLPDTNMLQPEISFDKSFMMAVPFKIFKSAKYKGRGKSIFDSKSDNFDALDEAWSQWMDALRHGRSKEYIPENMLPRNPETGELLKPNAFDNAYIQCDKAMGETESNKINLIQPEIPHESYLATYVTALDLCLQGIISPSTMGIDTKKLDNAEAQREKEKATLYTRNKIVNTIQDTIPEVINTAIKVMAVRDKTTIEDVKAEIPFGEYANPSFESQVETVSKGRSAGVMSLEASVEELYGDSKEQTWKDEEVKRLKIEQGIEELDDPSVGDDIFSIGFQG